MEGDCGKQECGVGAFSVNEQHPTLELRSRGKVGFRLVALPNKTHAKYKAKYDLHMTFLKAFGQ